MKKNAIIGMARLLPGLALFAAPLALAGSETVQLNPVKDNTLIETSDGSLSLGGAQHFYAGRVGPMGGGTLRRAVLAFDLSDIPCASTVIEVTLQMNMTQTVSGEQTVTLRRLLADWGEGTSNHPGGFGGPSTPNDATWLHTFYPDQFWATPGGDFVSAVSATQSVGVPGQYIWGSTPELVADVQGWIDDPATNFGWIVRGNEDTLQTAQQYASRLHSDPAIRPLLTVVYEPGPTGDLNCDGVVNVSDLLILFDNWGDCADCDDCPADLNDDCVVNVSDLLTLFDNWG